MDPIYLVFIIPPVFITSLCLFCHCILPYFDNGGRSRPGRCGPQTGRTRWIWWRKGPGNASNSINYGNNNNHSSEGPNCISGGVVGDPCVGGGTTGDIGGGGFNSGGFGGGCGMDSSF